jgi:hypothetical protein
MPDPLAAPHPPCLQFMPYILRQESRYASMMAAGLRVLAAALASERQDLYVPSVGSPHEAPRCPGELEAEVTQGGEGEHA